MALKIEIPDSQIATFRALYKEKATNIIEGIKKLQAEWMQIQPILVQLDIFEDPNNSALPVIKATEVRHKTFSLFEEKLEYHKLTTWGQKAIYILKTKGASTSNQIIDHLLQLEPTLSKQLVLNSIPATLSVMAKDGKIIRQKNEDNGEYIYDLK